jgi:hypothetical protein
MHIENITKSVYKSLQCYNYYIGEDPGYLWEDLSSEQVSVLVKCTKEAIKNTLIYPKDIHKIYSTELKKHKWKYGEIVDTKNKEHPHLRLYEDLSEEDQLYYTVFLCSIVAILTNTDKSQSKDEK